MTIEVSMRASRAAPYHGPTQFYVSNSNRPITIIRGDNLKSIFFLYRKKWMGISSRHNGRLCSFPPATARGKVVVGENCTLCNKGRKWAISSEGEVRSARVGVEGARDRDEAANTLPDSEIAFLPVLHIVFLTKAWQGLFYVCESKRGLGISSRTQHSWKSN